MNITIEELLAGKSTIIKNKEFFPTKIYVEPFLEKLKPLTNDFRIQVKTPDQVTTTKGGVDMTFNRVWIQAVLPDKYAIDFHDEVIGFLYGIDVKTPIVKLYRGYLNRACTNLTVFEPTWLNVQELIPGDPINFAPIKSLLEATNTFPTKLENLKSTYLDRNERKNYLGEWVDFTLREYQDLGFGKVKMAVSTPIDAYTSLFLDGESEYFIPLGIDPSLYDVYNSFTQVITEDKKDILNKFEKVMLINKLLKV